MSTSVPTTGVSAAQNVVDELLSFVERTRGISQAQRRRVLDQAAIALYNTTQETPRSRIVTQLGGTSSFASLRCAASSASDGARSTNQQVNNIILTHPSFSGRMLLARTRRDSDALECQCATTIDPGCLGSSLLCRKQPRISLSTPASQSLIMSGNDSYIRMGEVLHMCEYGQHNLDARSHLLEHTATLLCYAGQLELKFYSNSYDLWDALNRKKANEYNNEPWDKLYFRISMLRAYMDLGWPLQIVKYSRRLKRQSEGMLGLECNLPKMATNQYSQIDQCLEIIHHSNISAAYRRQLLTLTARALHSIDRPTPHQGTGVERSMVLSHDDALLHRHGMDPRFPLTPTAEPVRENNTDRLGGFFADVKTMKSWGVVTELGGARRTMSPWNVLLLSCAEEQAGTGKEACLKVRRIFTLPDPESLTNNSNSNRLSASNYRSLKSLTMEVNNPDSDAPVFNTPASDDPTPSNLFTIGAGSIIPDANPPVKSDAVSYQRFENLMIPIERQNAPANFCRHFLEMAMIPLWRLVPGPNEGSTVSVWLQIKERFFRGREPSEWNERFIRLFHIYFLELARPRP
ncbi:hypothetical protein IWX49DRAFT_625928 [Phyllosticta citricarpa]